MIVSSQINSNSDKSKIPVEFLGQQIRYDQQPISNIHSIENELEARNRSVQSAFQIQMQNFVDVPADLHEHHYFKNEVQTTDRDFFSDPFFDESKRCGENLGETPYKKVQKSSLLDKITHSEAKYLYS